MVNYTKPELEVTEFEIVDILTTSLQGSNAWEGENGNRWY